MRHWQLAGSNFVAVFLGLDWLGLKVRRLRRRRVLRKFQLGGTDVLVARSRFRDVGKRRFERFGLGRGNASVGDWSVRLLRGQRSQIEEIDRLSDERREKDVRIGNSDLTRTGCQNSRAENCAQERRESQDEVLLSINSDNEGCCGRGDEMPMDENVGRLTTVE